MTHHRKSQNLHSDAGKNSPLGVAIGHQDRALLDMVGDAIAQKQVRLAYQPVVLAKNPKQIAFYEGLVRVMDAAKRVIPAKDFMAQVETTTLGRQLDCIALELGMTALKDHPHLRLSVNMSARSIGYQPWKAALRRGLSLRPDIASRLILEISENSAMLVPDIVTAFMEEFQREGVAIALDNFGSGQMAIRYFREFFFDIVKIDRQFIRAINTDPDAQAIVGALISMSTHFNMFTVAEAVETVAEAETLRALGINCLQGFLFGAPSMKDVFSER